MADEFWPTKQIWGDAHVRTLARRQLGEEGARPLGSHRGRPEGCSKAGRARTGSPGILQPGAVTLIRQGPVLRCGPPFGPGQSWSRLFLAIACAKVVTLQLFCTTRNRIHRTYAGRRFDGAGIRLCIASGDGYSRTIQDAASWKGSATRLPAAQQPGSSAQNITCPATGDVTRSTSRLLGLHSSYCHLRPRPSPGRGFFPDPRRIK
jgi:hypothetical protein